MATQGDAQGQTYPVQLFVYDLSNGLARSLSRQLTGRHFDAIYHTSIVAYGKEWYFGQGIFSETPGRTHFGQPIQRHDLGSTSVDPATFQEILDDLRPRYTPQSYHLLQHNCNTFSNEVANILVGKDIPAHITSLPQDFLSTPFGRMMAPQINAMFGGGSGSAPPPSLGGAPPAALGMLNQVTHAAMSNGQAIGSSTAASVPALRHIESVAQLDEMKRQTNSVVIMFTSQTCPPCVQLHPVFERLAERYGEQDKQRDRPVAFAMVESSAQSVQLMQRERITATPTFQFYAAGNKVSELKGASPSSLEDGIEALLWHSHRPHPHSKLPNPANQVPRQAIRNKTIPNIMMAQQKFNDITSKHVTASFDEKADLQDARAVLTKTLFPWIHQGMAVNQKRRMAPADVKRCLEAAKRCIEILNVRDVFPVVDLVRISLLDDQLAADAWKQGVGKVVLDTVCSKAKEGMDPANKAALLTTFRLLGNAMATPVQEMAMAAAKQDDVHALLMYGMLAEDVGIRGAAINAVFNRALALTQSGRSLFVPAQDATNTTSDDEEIELVCSLLECVERETDLERLHRATAALCLSLYCAPAWQASLQPLLEVMEASFKLQTKAKAVEADSDAKAAGVAKLLTYASSLCRAS